MSLAGLLRRILHTPCTMQLCDSSAILTWRSNVTLHSSDFDSQLIISYSGSFLGAIAVLIGLLCAVTLQSLVSNLTICFLWFAIVLLTAEVRVILIDAFCNWVDRARYLEILAGESRHGWASSANESTCSWHCPRQPPKQLRVLQSRLVARNVITVQCNDNSCLQTPHASIEANQECNEDRRAQ